MMPGSTFQTSPPSMMIVGQPAWQASRRNEPLGPLPLMMISAPKDSASRADLRVGHVGPDVGVVRAADGGRVQVDAVVAPGDDLVEDDAGHAAGQAAARRSGKRAVQVAAVRQVAGVPVEGQHIQHRNEDHRSPEQPELLVLDQLADGAGAVDLVAVQGGGDEHDRARLGGPADVDAESAPSCCCSSR